VKAGSLTAGTAACVCHTCFCLHYL